jgi:iron complex transport system substrate-binding protein
MRFVQHILTLLLVCATLCACGGSSHHGEQRFDDSIALRHARLLHIYRSGAAHVVVIDNPWKKGEVLHRYVLLPRGVKAGQLPQGDLIRTPLRRLTVFTSVHACLMDELDAMKSMIGVCDLEYIHSQAVTDAVRSGKVKNMGNALNPNVELILSRHTDGLLVSPFEQSGYGALERTGLPLIECADYMEASPLGRAEWIRFYGMLIGRERQADSLFRQVETSYNKLKALARKAKNRPSVMPDQMNGAAWYVPGGNSTIGRVYQDAGCNYLFSDYEVSGSVRLNYETVLKRAEHAQFWFIKYGRAKDYTYATLKQENNKYTRFMPYQSRHIYGCNTLIVPFYEQEPFHPDLYLADIIHILHPELLPHHQLQFFKPLDE